MAYVEQIACNGLLDELKHLHMRGLAKFSVEVLANAILNDQVDVVDWLYKTYPKNRFCDPVRDCNTAALLEWMLRTYQWTESMPRFTFFEHGTINAACNGVAEALKLVFGDFAFDTVAGHGNLELLKWLHAHGASGIASVMDSAAAENHMETVQCLHENLCEGCITSAMDYAAAGDYLAMVQWLHQHRSEGCTTCAMDEAVAQEYLEIVQWLNEIRSEGCTTSAMDNAAGNGHLDMVKWIHMNRKEGCTTKALNRSAANGDLELVKSRTEQKAALSMR